MDFTNLNINEKTIFSSTVSLEYKNKNLEASYRSISSKCENKNMLSFCLILLIMGVFMSTLEGILFFFNQDNKNIKWNFIYTSGLMVINSVILGFLLNSGKGFIAQDRSVARNTCHFCLHFFLDNYFLSLVSILIAYYNSCIELISAVLFIKLLLKCFLSILVHRNFLKSLLIPMIILTYKSVFLLSIHTIRVVIYYLIMMVVFNMIILCFVYLYEYMTRIYFYSFLMLAKEKEYFLETMNFFNISYFASRNKKITKSIKLETLFKKVGEEGKDFTEFNQENFEFRSPVKSTLTLSSIDKLMKKLVSVDQLNFPPAEKYLMDSVQTGNFKFKQFIKILKKHQNFKNNYNNIASESTCQTANSENLFRKFTSVGILKIDEDLFLQVFLKIKIKNNQQSHRGDIYENVKIEGLFFDVTQSQMKKQTQVNSLILAKYVHDLKSPLILLEKMVQGYKQKFLRFYNSLGAQSNEENNISDCASNIEIISKSIFEMIHSINNFTKKQNNINSQHEEKGMQMVNIRKIINECVDFYRIFTKYINNNDGSPEDKVKIHADIDLQVPKYIYTDRTAVKQVLMNLMSNSIKFTYHGEVKIICQLKSKVELHEQKKFVVINVVDTGMGIEEDVVKKLCQPFSYSSPNVCQGSGLGLSIVSDLLSTLNSQLLIYSKRNKGSNFSFEIPSENCREAELEFVEDIENSEAQVNLNGPCFGEELMEFIEDDKQTCYFEGPIFNDEILNLYKLIGKENVNSNTDSNFSQFQKEIEKNSHYFSDSKRTSGTNNENTLFKPVKKKYYSAQNVTKYKNKIKIINIHSHQGSRFASRKQSIDSQDDEGNWNRKVPKKVKTLQSDKLVSITSMGDVISSSEINLNILVLDDDPLYLSQVKYQLNTICRSLGVSVFIKTGNDPVDGLYTIYKLLKQKNLLFDLVICDENMPFMKGSSFVKLYKESLTHNGFYKTLFASSSGDSLSTNFSRNMINTLSSIHISNSVGDFDFYINKPSKRTEIQSLLEKILTVKKEMR